jgi:sugar phosphate isomerase/epimerase
MRYGISTHLFHDLRLESQHLATIAAHGFETIELFATRSHFDYRDEGAIGRLADWLRDTGLSIHSIHAPITTGYVDGRWGPALSNAWSDAAERRAAVEETVAALAVARQVPVGFLVVHLGVPADLADAIGINSRDAAQRSLEEVRAAAAPLGVRVAVEVIPNELSAPETLVTMLEEDLDLPDVGLCLDYGHAFLMGDVVDAIETLSGHLVTTHVHDNHGRGDDHLLPFEGGIDWAAALMATQKVGYDGTLMFEVAAAESALAVLHRTRHVRTRFEELIV